MITVAAGMLLTAMAACCAPAWRAARIDPAEAPTRRLESKRGGGALALFQSGATVFGHLRRQQSPWRAREARGRPSRHSPRGSPFGADQPGAQPIDAFDRLARRLALRLWLNRSGIRCLGQPAEPAVLGAAQTAPAANGAALIDRQTVEGSSEIEGHGT